MKCLLVFDHLNDIIYTKYNKKFAVHINDYAKAQNLLNEDANSSKLTANVIVQIFSPLVTSQRIMSCQFGNSYTSIQCQDGLNMTFEEYMGYLFVSIGLDDVQSMKRTLNTFIAIVRFLCGPNVVALKTNTQLAALLTGLIDTWIYLYSNDQAFYTESVEQLIVNAELSTAALQSVQEAVDKLKHVTECNKTHALIFVENKFLTLYSSQNAKELSATDILFMQLLADYINKKRSDVESDGDSDEEYYSPSSSPVHSTASNLAEIFQPEVIDLSSYQVLLTGNDFEPKCIPHCVHLKRLNDGVTFVVLIETGSPQLAVNLYNTFLHIHTLQTVQIQRDVETLRPIFDSLDTSVKKLCDGLRRIKSVTIEAYYKELSKKWDFMRKKYLEFIKMKDDAMDALLRAESATAGLLDVLNEILSITAFDHTVLKASQRFIDEIAKCVMARLATYSDYLKVKALRNFPLVSRTSLTINKYLEEFPGLVHFLYIDRTTHRITTPSLDFNSEQTNALTKKKIWAMINFSRNHLQDGHLSLMWKDTTFNYAYFLWFEDMAGSPLKPTIFPTNASKALPQSGILCGDFYQKLKEACFPKVSPMKIRCYELYCIHLGLATSSCVLEHTRRLAASIWELRGHPNHPVDFL